MVSVRHFAVMTLIACVLTTSSHAQVIESLVSPNAEIDGEFGWSVGGPGDVNADDIPDVIVGAHTEDPGTSPWNAGRAYVFDGEDLSILHSLLSPNEEQAGKFGYAVDLLENANRDETDRIVVSAIGESPDALLIEAGRVYVFDGSDGTLVHTLVSPNAQVGGWFGYSVSSAGDVDGDGSIDIVVGAHEEEPDPSPIGAGRAYVFSGLDGSLIHELVSPNEQNEGYFGYSVAAAGDVNDDGSCDVIIGARGESTGSSPDGAGRAYVFSGSDASLLYTLTSPNEEIEGYFGGAVAGGGDVTGDSIPDLVVGADHEDPGTSPEETGRAYVFDGQNGSLVYTLASPNQEEEGFFGYSVDFAGDMDGDGHHDVVIGAFWEVRDPALAAAGRAYVFRGSDGTVLYTLMSPTPESGGFFGCSVSALGDVDENGFDDVVVGAVFENPGESPQDAGRAHIVFPEGQGIETGPSISTTPGYARLVKWGPNPARCNLSVLYSIEHDVRCTGDAISLKIYDLSGRLMVVHSGLSMESGLHWETVPLQRTALASGSYVLALSSQSATVLDAKRLVISD